MSRMGRGGRTTAAVTPPPHGHTRTHRPSCRSLHTYRCDMISNEPTIVLKICACTCGLLPIMFDRKPKPWITTIPWWIAGSLFSNSDTQPCNANLSGGAATPAQFLQFRAQRCTNHHARNVLPRRTSNISALLSLSAESASAAWSSTGRTWRQRGPKPLAPKPLLLCKMHGRLPTASSSGITRQCETTIRNDEPKRKCQKYAARVATAT